MVKYLPESKYAVCFHGTTCGVLFCDTLYALRNTLTDTFLSPDVEELLLDAKNWIVDWADGLPFFCEHHILTNQEHYWVRIYRVKELTS